MLRWCHGKHVSRPAQCVRLPDRAVGSWTGGCPDEGEPGDPVARNDRPRTGWGLRRGQDGDGETVAQRPCGKRSVARAIHGTSRSDVREERLYPALRAVHLIRKIRKAWPGRQLVQHRCHGVRRRRAVGKPDPGEKPERRQCKRSRREQPPGFARQARPHTTSCIHRHHGTGCRDAATSGPHTMDSPRTTITAGGRTASRESSTPCARRHRSCRHGRLGRGARSIPREALACGIGRGAAAAVHGGVQPRRHSSPDVPFPR